MAAALLRRNLFLGAVLVSAGALVVLALVGERENTSLAEFTPQGVMVRIDPRDIRKVAVSAGARHWEFSRSGRSWESPDANWPAGRAERIDLGLKLLHNSAPQAVFTEEESRDLASFGLETPALRVTASGPDGDFTVEFGSLNPMGLARYARVGGTSNVMLIPRFVADTWEQVLGLQ